MVPKLALISWKGNILREGTDLPKSYSREWKAGSPTTPTPHNPTLKPRLPVPTETPAISSTLVWPLLAALLTAQLQTKTGLDLVSLSQALVSQLFHEIRSGGTL